MSVFGIRKKIKSFIKQSLHLNEEVPPETEVHSPVSPAYEEASPEKEEESLEDLQEAPSPQEEETETVVEEKEQEEQKENISAKEVTMTPSFQEGRELTPEAVQEVLDDDVRPALQMDGGDIVLVNVADNNIYVKLVGACSTCPSSVMTMRMGVENLLREEFPALNELIEVQEEEVEA